MATVVPLAPLPTAVMHSASSQVSALVRRWGEGDQDAFDLLVPIVYDRLRQLARRQRRRDPAATLDTTAVVHEAYLKLVRAPRADLRDRAHFLSLASRVMRNLLADHARARRAAKRGAGAGTVSLDEESAWLPDAQLDAIEALDEALERLALLDARLCRVVEQRYFGGLSLEETAEALGVSLATAKRDLRSARAWLAAELAEDVLA